MTFKSDFLLNDHRFIETVTCPLKYSFLLQDSKLAERPPVFRQLNKLRLRDAIALQFENCKRTSDDFLTAAAETESWLKEREVAICGAVIKKEGLVTRIPILLKRDDHYTIIQVHGKLRKRPGRAVLSNPENRRSTAVMALKAAYRTEILSRVLPDAEVDVRFYFPQKSFFAKEDDLNRFNRDVYDQDSVFQELFMEIDATGAAISVRNQLPAIAVHPEFAGIQVSNAIDIIFDYAEGRNNQVERHSGCSHCPYRKSENGIAGCWEKNFTDETIQNRDLHVPDLIGVGNSDLLGRGILFQEEIQINDGFHEFDLMEEHGGSAITIQQRRDLQILRAKEKESPLLWIKKDAQKLWSLTYPIHFIDFEAATYAIPMRRGDRPYTPLCFQFSCHTLNEDGTVKHTGWLHEEPVSANLHAEFSAKLTGIPDITRGTIVHYSPFERQAVQRILGEFQRDKQRYRNEIEMLNAFITGTDPAGGERFADLSEYIRRYYYNSFMTSSLSLKETLESALKLEQNYPFKIRTHEIIEKITSRHEFIGQVKPYQKVQNRGAAIRDGSTAMHAWIAQKNGLLTDTVSEQINRLLHAYCEIDSLAMVFLYKHLLRHVSRLAEEDTILF